MKHRWRMLYAKVRADLAGTLATGGLTTAGLYVLEALDVATTTEEKTLIVGGLGYLGGKLAAFLRPETGPVVVTPTPPTLAGGRSEPPEGVTL
jgi:hypothetical protein